MHCTSTKATGSPVAFSASTYARDSICWLIPDCAKLDSKVPKVRTASTIVRTTKARPAEAATVAAVRRSLQPVTTPTTPADPATT